MAQPRTNHIHYTLDAAEEHGIDGITLDDAPFMRRRFRIHHRCDYSSEHDFHEAHLLRCLRPGRMDRWITPQ